jgi:hypothetical protein
MEMITSLFLGCDAEKVGVYFVHLKRRGKM